MDYLIQYKKSLENKTHNASEDVLNMLLRKKQEIKNLIKQRWIIGKRPDGGLIGRYKRYSYSIEKNNKNSKAGFGNVDLIDTGALVNKIDMSLIGLGIEIYSTDEKYNEIADKYGDDNFNITDAQQEEIFEEVYNNMILKYMNELWA